VFSHPLVARRLFFCTPQSFHNDIENGAVDPLRIVLVVFDEAHRASGACHKTSAPLCQA
jgi:ERCC4-related helicase